MLLQKNETLSSIIRFGPTNTLKIKMTPLSSIINYKYETKGLLQAIFPIIIKYLIGFLDWILRP